MVLGFNGSIARGKKITGNRSGIECLPILATDRTFKHTFVIYSGYRVVDGSGSMARAMTGSGFNLALAALQYYVTNLVLGVPLRTTSSPRRGSRSMCTRLPPLPASTFRGAGFLNGEGAERAVPAAGW
jgi:hypothetical protein